MIIENISMFKLYDIIGINLELFKWFNLDFEWTPNMRWRILGEYIDKFYYFENFIQYISEAQWLQLMNFWIQWLTIFKSIHKFLFDIYNHMISNIAFAKVEYIWQNLNVSSLYYDYFWNLELLLKIINFFLDFVMGDNQTLFRTFHHLLKRERNKNLNETKLKNLNA
jgi:hypothetical protein